MSCDDLGDRRIANNMGDVKSCLALLIADKVVSSTEEKNSGTLRSEYVL